MVRVTVIASETLVGELNGSLTSRVKDIADTLDNAGIPSRASDNIMRDIWHKALYNIALNPLSAIFGVSYGEIADNPHTRRLIKQMISEAFQVARASGQSLGINTADEYLEKSLFYL
jgi:2-dehydropantoate 2-reductase